MDQKCRSTGNISANGLVSGVPVPATFVGCDIMPNVVLLVKDGASGPAVFYGLGPVTGPVPSTFDLHGAVYCANGIHTTILVGNVILRYA